MASMSYRGQKPKGLPRTGLESSEVVVDIDEDDLPVSRRANKNSNNSNSNNKAEGPPPTTKRLPPNNRYDSKNNNNDDDDDIVDINEDDLPVSRRANSNTNSNKKEEGPPPTMKRLPPNNRYDNSNNDDDDSENSDLLDQQVEQAAAVAVTICIPSGNAGSGAGGTEADFFNEDGDEQGFKPQQQQRQQRRQQVRPSFVYNSIKSNEDQAALEFRSGAVLCFICLVVLGVLFGAAGTALGIVNTIDNNKNNNNNGGGNAISDSQQKGATKPSTLETIYQRGYINCGVGTGQLPGFVFDTYRKDSQGNAIYAGLEVDLCLALTAAIFNGKIQEPNNGLVHYRLLPIATTERWQALGVHQTIDVLFGATITMERDTYEASTGLGFEFTTPYFWDGLVFGGLPEHLACAEALDFNSSVTCEQTKICVAEGTTHSTIIRNIKPPIPPQNLIATRGTDSTLSFPGQCNVLANEVAYINSRALALRGYSGPFQLGNKSWSKEPIAMVTREGDPRWSDFVQWVLQGLIFAEEKGITKTSALFHMGTTQVFVTEALNRTGSPSFESMFRHAVAQNGNYGEIYNFNLESFLPSRENKLNAINKGDLPIMNALPWGDINLVAPELEVVSPTVKAIKQRGFLNCGINTRKGFAEFNLATRTWSGFDVDLCRALAAAIFDGVDRVVFTDLPAAQRFPALADGRVDVLARLTTVTLARDVQEPQTKIGLSFAAPYFYDGLTFGGIPPFTNCADNLNVISADCQKLKVCLLQGTTTLTSVQSFLRAEYISAKLTFKEVIDGLNDGSCNAIAGGFHDVAVDTIRERGYLGNYSVGSRRHSKDPLALTTRQNDAAWSDFVHWIFNALVYADEQGITQATAADMPRIKLFGPLRTTAFFLAVNAVGNYGEIYNRNFGTMIPRAGMHLNNQENGPMLYALPGIPTSL